MPSLTSAQDHRAGKTGSGGVTEDAVKRFPVAGQTVKFIVEMMLSPK